MRNVSDAVEDSEDSTKLNTAFIERLNLTIRQGSAYLRRRSPCPARSKRTLDDHVVVFRCYYESARPNGALRFHKVTRTPAIQAGLAAEQLSVRDVFAARHVAARSAVARMRAVPDHEPIATSRRAA